MKLSDNTKFTKEDAAKWLSELRLACSRTKVELILRIKTYLNCPKLTQNLKLRANCQLVFPCMNSNEVPQPSALLWSDTGLIQRSLTKLLNHTEHIKRKVRTRKNNTS